MFRFFKKRINTSTTSHEPLDGRTGHIGGIESLVLDDVRYFFGFSPNSDLVVSPLIADMEEMARFASRHMEQMDGLHDEAYWLQEASYAIEESELCSTPEERTFTSDALANFVAGLQQAVKTDSIVPGLSLESHLLYLLDAAGGWEAQNATDIHIETSIAIVAGEEEPAEDSSVAEHALGLLEALRVLVDAAPGNWSTLFAVLKAA
jgi:hypothetical protein